MHQVHTLPTPPRQHQEQLHTILLQHLVQHLQLQQLLQLTGNMSQVGGLGLSCKLHYTHMQACVYVFAEGSSQHTCLYAVSNTKDNPPCNTLFVGNLGDTVSEAELRQLFGTLAGFRQLKLIRGARSVTCFVEFNDLPSAMACHQNQQVLRLVYYGTQKAKPSVLRFLSCHKRVCGDRGLC